MIPDSIIVRRGCDSVRRKLCEEGLPPLAARVLSARNIAARQDIVPPLSTLPPPEILPQIDKLCDILADAIRNHKKIWVVGDYDADGMCATALAVESLRQLGAETAWRIPERTRHGYGLHEDIAEEAAADNAAVLLTVDNGVAAGDAVARAKSLGMKVCITDHHLLPSTLPDADCIVNPQLGGSDSPGVNLAGVGVAFYAMAALRKHLDSPLKMAPFLDLVAVGTVADCVPMDTLNRTLVGGGLAQIRHRGGRPGIAALAAAAKMNSATCTCRDISHAIAPRINAAGRLDNSETAVQCLLADNMKEARRTAAKLSAFNVKRKEIVERIMAQTAAPPPTAAAVVVSDSEWPAGVIGIVAGRLADLYGRPTVVFARVNGEWRGSGRTPPGRDLYRLVADAAKNATVLKFGGHRRAVGITVHEVAPFARAFEECCRAAPADAPQWQVDETPPQNEITTTALECLDEMVWGEEFSRPLFAGTFAVSEVKPIGQSHIKMRLRGDGLNLPALAFYRREIGDTTTAIFSLTKDLYTGNPAAIIESIIGA